jgi:hypothetical protein
VYKEMGKSHAKLSRGIVWCTVCGKSKNVNSATCFRTGWPECCGYTMTIDSPQERARFNEEEKRANISKGY